MIIPRKPLGRRAVLRGLGVAMALPLLDGMIASSAAAETARLPKRLQIFHSPNGMMMESFTPATTGMDYALSPILQPLDRYRDRFTVISGLVQTKKNETGAHAFCTAGFLSGAVVKHTDGFDFRAGTSMDQIVAKQFGQATRLASLETGLDLASLSGTCVVGDSCAYTNSLSWRNDTTPLPPLINPRDVFEQLFGDGDTVDPKSRAAQLQRHASILDAVMEDAASMAGRLGSNDRHKLDQYMEAVRDVERRIQKAERDDAEAITTDFARPSGVPGSFEEHVHMMIDLQVLALQADITRVCTFMLGREISNRTYPEIGVADAHHMLSHHGNDPDKKAKLVKINIRHMEMFAHYLKRLEETRDGEGTLLDRTLVLRGSGFGDPNEHDHMNLPILVAGGLAPSRGHVAVPKTPLANLLVSMMQVLGVEQASIGDSTGPLEQLA